jgi:hypothetical protein
MTTILADQSPATPTQVETLHGLFDQKFAPNEAADYHRWLNTRRMSLAGASAAITRLCLMPNVNEIAEGMYRVGKDIYKVYRTRDKNILVTKTLTEDGFEYTGMKPLRFIKVEHRMTLDEAKEYGKVTGTCCNCGRKLTKESSIAAGIGPICAGNF